MMMMMYDTDSNYSFVPIEVLWLCDHLLQMFETMRGKMAQEVEDGEDKHATQKQLDQELRQAVRDRHDSSLSKVWDLCHRGASVLQVDPDDGTTLLHVAARAGNNKIFQYLSICRGAAGNHWYKQDRRGDTILQAAAKANNVYLVQWILQNTFFFRIPFSATTATMIVLQRRSTSSPVHVHPDDNVRHEIALMTVSWQRLHHPCSCPSTPIG